MHPGMFILLGKLPIFQKLYKNKSEQKVCVMKNYPNYAYKSSMAVIFAVICGFWVNLTFKIEQKYKIKVGEKSWPLILHLFQKPSFLEPS